MEEDVHEMRFDRVIICAGAWSGQVGKMAGIGQGEGGLQYAIPVEPRYPVSYLPVRLLKFLLKLSRESLLIHV